MAISCPSTPPGREQLDSIPTFSGQVPTVLLKADISTALSTSEARAVLAQGGDSTDRRQFHAQVSNSFPDQTIPTISRARHFQIICSQFLLSHTSHTLPKWDLQPMSCYSPREDVTRAQGWRLHLAEPHAYSCKNRRVTPPTPHQ